MNKARRKELEKALDLIERGKDMLEDIEAEEQEAFDNMPESLQESERGEHMQEIIDALEEYIGYLDTDDLMGIVEG